MKRRCWQRKVLTNAYLDFTISKAACACQRYKCKFNKIISYLEENVTEKIILCFQTLLFQSL